MRLMFLQIPLHTNLSLHQIICLQIDHLSAPDDLIKYQRKQHFLCRKGVLPILFFQKHFAGCFQSRFQTYQVYPSTFVLLLDLTFRDYLRSCIAYYRKVFRPIVFLQKHLLIYLLCLLFYLLTLHLLNLELVKSYPCFLKKI